MLVRRKGVAQRLAVIWLVEDAPTAERASLCMYSYVSCRGNEPLSAKRAVSIPRNVTSRPRRTVLFHPGAGMGSKAKIAPAISGYIGFMLLTAKVKGRISNTL